MSITEWFLGWSTETLSLNQSETWKFIDKLRPAYFSDGREFSVLEKHLESLGGRREALPLPDAAAAFPGEKLAV